jgi:hypothetical protein
MTRASRGLTFEATAGCIALIAGAALGLIIYAALTLVDLLPRASAQALSILPF